MADLWQNDYFDGRFRHNGVLQEYPGYCTDVWFNLSLDWIKQRKAANEPFFLYLPTNAPHGPLWVADKYKQMYAGSGGPANFFGMPASILQSFARDFPGMSSPAYIRVMASIDSCNRTF